MRYSQENQPNRQPNYNLRRTVVVSLVGVGAVAVGAGIAAGLESGPVRGVRQSIGNWLAADLNEKEADVQSRVPLVGARCVQYTAEAGDTISSLVADAKDDGALSGYESLSAAVFDAEAAATVKGVLPQGAGFIACDGLVYNPDQVPESQVTDADG